VSIGVENFVPQKTLRTVLACALLCYGGSALAFTLIEIPSPPTSPSNVVTDATTLSSQIQPLTGAIRTQLLALRGMRRAARVAQAGALLAVNTHADRRSDVNYLAAALGESSGAGSGAGNTESLWISSAYNSLENDFSRTRFHGDTHQIVAGFDLTRSDRYVLGVAFNHEASNFVTDFNFGNQKTRGFNLSPYFAYLLSDTWSLDLSLGHGEFDTDQSRTVATLLGPAAVGSTFSSTRDFASANLTAISAPGNWRLTGSTGVLGAKRKDDAYLEANGNAVANTDQTLKQWNLFGEAAYGRGDSEAYFGLLYEKLRDPPRIEFPSGEQPANDPDSVLLSAGWRYFGKGLTANFAFSSRQAQDQVNEYGFSMMIRVDL
jgi:hypothetical protein